MKKTIAEKIVDSYSNIEIIDGFKTISPLEFLIREGIEYRVDEETSEQSYDGSLEVVFTDRSSVRVDNPFQRSFCGKIHFPRYKGKNRYQAVKELYERYHPTHTCMRFGCEQDWEPLIHGFVQNVVEGKHYVLIIDGSLIEYRMRGGKFAWSAHNGSVVLHA